jgi:pimeloyl-ACP methyl ester carboxylesterase
MPTNKINGVDLYWEMTGTAGEPLVLVHGSWGDHHNWDSVVAELSKNFRVVTYDRRGHSQSERLTGQGNTEEDVADLIALIEILNLSPAHIAGNSFGAAITLKAATWRPDIFQSLIVHEPPLFGIIKDETFRQTMLPVLNSRIEAVMDLLEKKKDDEAAKQFVETIAFGPGAWEQLPSQMKAIFVHNAPTFYDEILDPGSLVMDTGGLKNFTKPALLTHGTQSPPFFLMVMDILKAVLPHAKHFTFEGAGHVPHLSHPAKYIEVVTAFCRENSKAGKHALHA